MLCIEVVWTSFFSLPLPDFFILITYIVFPFGISKHRKSSGLGAPSVYLYGTSDSGMVMRRGEKKLWTSCLNLEEVQEFQRWDTNLASFCFYLIPLKLWGILLWEICYWPLVLYYKKRTHWRKSAFRVSLQPFDLFERTYSLFALKNAVYQQCNHQT